MRMNNKSFVFRRQSGSVIVIVVLGFVVLMGIMALAVDIGYVATSKNELQNAADAASLAAAGLLGNIYAGMEYESQISYNVATTDSDHDGAYDDEEIRQRALAVGLSNKAANLAITINTADVQIGRWNPSATPSFTITDDRPNAVRTITRREAGTNGPIVTFFASIMGINTVPVNADAVAALTGESTSAPGAMDVPFGISEARFSVEYCDQPIRFSPTGPLIACAGWHTYFDTSNTSNLRNIIDGMDDGSFVSPGTEAGSTIIEFYGGEVSNQLENLADFFEAHATPVAPTEYLYIDRRIDGNPELVSSTNSNLSATPGYEYLEKLYYGDGTTERTKKEYHALVPVYAGDDCNPSGGLLIVGYAEVNIISVIGKQNTVVVEGATETKDADHTIFAEIKCGGVSEGRGGGNDYGTFGSIPGLVEQQSGTASG